MFRVKRIDSLFGLTQLPLTNFTREVYFALEEFESAKAAFSQGLKLRQAQSSNRDTAPYARYIRKCNAEMAGMSVEYLSVRVET
jgi:hypothetical protein